MQTGFTLTELLVVIAIIGILSSIVLASLNTARKKGRDGRRLADLRQIANQVSLAESGSSAVNFIGCLTAGLAASTCTTPDLQSYKDPSAPASVCTAASSATCEYAEFVSTGAVYPATTQNWKVCAYLETAAGPRSSVGTAGMVYVDQDGSVKAGC